MQIDIFGLNYTINKQKILCIKMSHHYFHPPIFMLRSGIQDLRVRAKTASVAIWTGYKSVIRMI